MPEKKLGGPLSILLGLLALVLAVRAGSGFAGRQVAKRSLAEGQAEVERLGAEQRRLKAELDALQHDPIYLEQVLRSNRRVGPGEAPPPR